MAFATATRQEVVLLDVNERTTVRQAVNLSGVAKLFPDYDFSSSTLGVFGKTVPDDHIPSEHDRVEIYRPLRQSPTDARRQRVKSAQKRNSR
ncbi:MAG: RnfH family protein [Acidiferrobacterales bacterium]|nr:RnfH family protein [Acidiferrobacterales bacterium]